MVSAFRSWMDKLLAEFRTLSVAEVGVFKICLVCLGLLLGLQEKKVLKPYQPLILITLLSSYAYLIFRLLIKPDLLANLSCPFSRKNP